MNEKPSVRVAVVTTSYPSRAGDWAGHFVRQEALELARAGCDVTVFTTRAAVSDEGVCAIALADGALSAFGPPGAAARLAAFPPRALSVVVWAARVRAALRRGRFERVVAHWAVPSAWPAALVGAAELEVVSHGGDVRILLALPAAARRALVGRIAAGATRWRFVSEELQRELVASLDWQTAERVRAIAHVRAPSLDVPDVAGRARDLRSRLGTFDVSLGRLVASKRVERAIDRAAARGELLVVVGDGPARPSLERRAERAAAPVRFVGALPREEALAYLAAARSLVFASEAEGCSTVLREAHELRTPVARVEG